jgi:hypothetical protein
LGGDEGLPIRLHQRLDHWLHHGVLPGAIAAKPGKAV